MNRPVRSNPQRARLIWVVAAVATAAVVALALTAAGIDDLEVLATLLFVVVFTAALLGGRTNGFLAAAGCTAVYLVLRSQDVDEVGTLAVGLLVLTRGACYVAVAHVTQFVRVRLPAADLPARLPTNWDADDAPVPTALYAGPAGGLGAERAAPAHDAYDAYDADDRWGDPDATAAAAWVDDDIGAGGWGEGRDDQADFAAAAASAGWAPGEAAEPMLAPVSSTPAPAGWDQPPETFGGYDEWGEPPLAAAPVDAGAGGGWDQPTGVMPQVPEAPAPAPYDPPAAYDPPVAPMSPDPAPWEVDLDAPAATGWAPGAYDRPPAPSMPTGWIDDATSPLGDETIPVGYTGELFIAREMARLPADGRPGPNGAPARVNGDPEHHGDRQPANGRPLAGAAAPPPRPADPPAAPGGGFGTPGPPLAAPNRAPGGGGGGYVPMSDPSEGIDPETRLWNARFFRERLAAARDMALRTGSGFSVVMIQVPDHPFQPLPYRRQVALLRELGHQFVSARLVDHLVHLPDENQHWFAVVLSDSDRAGATAFERRLRSAISGYLRNRGLHISEIQSLSLTSPDDDEAMSMVWSSLLGSSGGPEGPAMAYDGQI